MGDEPLVLTGRRLPYGRGITFWPLEEIVRSAAGIAADEPPETALERLRTAIGGVDGEVAERVASGVGLIDNAVAAVGAAKCWRCGLAVVSSAAARAGSEYGPRREGQGSLTDRATDGE